MRAYKIRKMNLTDHQKLPSVPIKRSEVPFQFINSHSLPGYQFLKMRLDSLLASSETAAFLIIRNDTIIYERYTMGFHENSILPSNSMAKSFTGSLVAIAIAEGYIKSKTEPVTNYIPELAAKDPRFGNITIRHLLDMRSGLDFNEGSYDLKDDAIKLGLSRNLKKQIIKKAKIAEAPGRFNYQSINTQLLGIIVERATGRKLQDYLEEKLWKAMGTENDATWNVDSRKHKHVITSAAINATARDFAKLGRLYLENGWHNEKQVITEEWIRPIASADSMEKYDGYKRQWWNRRVRQSLRDSLPAYISKQEKSDDVVIKSDQNVYSLQYRSSAFAAIGFLHQVIYVHPQKNLIIVRLGRGWRGPVRFTQFIYSLGEEL